MQKLLRRHLATIVVAFVTALVTAAGPAIAAGVASFARDSHKVDGKHAVGAKAEPADRAGRLVATDKNGFLPNDIVAAALDVDCSGCISDAELDGSGATQVELDAVSTTATDATGAAAAAQQKADTAASEVEALRTGLAAGTLALGGVSSPTTTTAAPLRQFTVHAPAPGTLTITVNARYWFDADATSASARISAGTIALCDSDASMCGGSSEIYYEDPDNTSSTNVVPNVILQRSVVVDEAGPRTFYVMGRTNTSTAAFSLYPGSSVSAMWTPQRLNITLP